MSPAIPLPEQAWLTVCQQLQQEQPKAPFHGWLREARALSYAEGTFTLGVADAYARAWLTDRLERTLANTLQGILNAPVEVALVAMTPENGKSPVADFQTDPAAAWAAARAHLQPTLADGDTAAWLADAHFLAYYDRRYVIGLPSLAACQGLAQAMSTQLTQVLQDLTQTPDLEVQFVAAPPADGAKTPPEQNKLAETATSTPGRPAAEAEILIKPLRTSLYTALTRPKSVLVVSAYLLRWLPYLGVDQGWFLVAMRQAFYRAYGTKVSGANCGRTFTVNRKQIARWAGLGDRKVWALLKQLEHTEQTGNFLAWFMQGTPCGPGKPKAYTFRADMPLTPGDAEALTGWLVGNGVQADPLGTLQAALESQPHELLPFPAPPPAARHHQLPPTPQAVWDVVQAAAGLAPADPRALPLKQLAGELERHLQSPADNLLITHYFMLEWLRKLGRTAAWLVTILRDRGFIDHHQGIRRDRVSLEGGYGELAAMLGVSERQIERWLPPLAEMVRRQGCAAPDSSWAKHQAKRELVGHFLEKDGQVDWQGNGDTRYEFKVQLEDPLTPAHQDLYNRLETLLHESLVSGDPSAVAGLAQALPPALVRERHNPKPAWPAKNTGAFDADPRNAQPAPDLVRELHTPWSAQDTALRELDPRSARLKALLVKHLNPKILLEVKQLLQQHLEEIRATEAPALEAAGVGGGQDLVWDWEKLLGYSGTDLEIRSEILHTPTLQQQFLGQALYGYTYRADSSGNGIRAPFKYAASRRHDCPPPEYMELAALPPEQLAELVADGIGNGDRQALSKTARRVASELRKNGFLAVIEEAARLGSQPGKT